MRICTHMCKYPQRPEEGKDARSPGTEGPSGFKLADFGAGD